MLPPPRFALWRSRRRTSRLGEPEGEGSGGSRDERRGGAPAGTGQVAYVTTDNLEIGRLAARTALKAGAFRTFGFVPNTDGAYWRKGREAGFLGAAGHGIRRVTYPGQDAPGSERDRRLLRNWLLALPKPAALLAEHDIRAAQVLELCKEADISVRRGEGIPPSYGNICQ